MIINKSCKGDLWYQQLFEVQRKLFGLQGRGRKKNRCYSITGALTEVDILGSLTHLRLQWVKWVYRDPVQCTCKKSLSERFRRIQSYKSVKSMRSTSEITNCLSETDFTEDTVLAKTRILNQIVTYSNRSGDSGRSHIEREGSPDTKAPDSFVQHVDRSLIVVDHFFVTFDDIDPQQKTYLYSNNQTKQERMKWRIPLATAHNRPRAAHI